MSPAIKRSTEYQLTYRNKAVKERVDSVIAWAVSTFVKPYGRRIARKQFDEIFGQSQNVLSALLRSIALVCVDEEYRYYGPGEMTKIRAAGGTPRPHPKSWMLNYYGMRYLYELREGITTLQFDKWKVERFAAEKRGELTRLSHNLSYIKPEMVNFGTDAEPFMVTNYDFKLLTKASDKHGEELKRLKFHYNRLSYRLWNTLQNLPSRLRGRFMSKHGLKHQYDISSCALTLVTQYANMIGDTGAIPHLASAVADKHIFRLKLAEIFGGTIGEAKLLLTALLCGARVGYGYYFSLGKLLGYEKIQLLKESAFITELKAEIKACWNVIKDTPGAERRKIYSYRFKKDVRLPLSSRQKWMLYFKLEADVLYAIVNRLEWEGAKYFLEHDGWSCDLKVDPIDMSDAVFSRTKYRVKFEYDAIE